MEYECRYDGCEHTENRIMQCDNSTHQNSTPQTKVHFLGLCELCICERDLCNARDYPTDASQLAEFARSFYRLKYRLDAGGNISTRVEGLVKKDDMGVLYEVLVLLSADIVWRGRPNRITDLPTSEERAIVSNLTKYAFISVVCDCETRRPHNIAR